jgi:hypothetical protein
MLETTVSNDTLSLLRGLFKSEFSPLMQSKPFSYFCRYQGIFSTTIPWLPLTSSSSFNN